MKLNMGDLIKYDGAIYEVVAVVWSTLYLRTVNSDRYDYKIDNLGKLYRDIEEHEQNAIIGNNLINMQYLLKLMNDDGTCKDTIEKLDEGIEQLNNTIEQYERLADAILSLKVSISEKWATPDSVVEDYAELDEEEQRKAVVDLLNTNGFQQKCSEVLVDDLKRIVADDPTLQFIDKTFNITNILGDMITQGIGCDHHYRG